MSLYRVDDGDIAHDVRAWCIANGNNPRLRIALAGYEGEHNVLTELGWEVVAWKAGRAYGRANGDTANSTNRKAERVWFSPHCLRGNRLF